MINVRAAALIDQALAEPRLVRRASDRSSISHCPTLNQVSSTSVMNAMDAKAVITSPQASHHLRISHHLGVA
jgi:hypothetical protein